MGSAGDLGRRSLCRKFDLRSNRRCGRRRRIALAIKVSCDCAVRCDHCSDNIFIARDRRTCHRIRSRTCGPRLAEFIWSQHASVSHLANEGRRVLRTCASTLWNACWTFGDHTLNARCAFRKWSPCANSCSDRISDGLCARIDGRSARHWSHHSFARRSQSRAECSTCSCARSFWPNGLCNILFDRCPLRPPLER